MDGSASELASTMRSMPSERWVRCRNSQGAEGLLPSNFLLRLLEPHLLEQYLARRPQAEAVYEFAGSEPGDLALVVSSSEPRQTCRKLKYQNNAYFRGNLCSFFSSVI
ncbi:unnamed protein product [Protopolystoma xenopodis]|uniref:Uncharacterized protein n=1 Tax=Protopolystoma xenopodis TaxID=117903 RepID=A0A3S5A6E5_9PLAT|nr:unnamed protein product [Protopolystoma xenopodis]